MPAGSEAAALPEASGKLRAARSNQQCCNRATSRVKLLQAWLRRARSRLCPLDYFLFDRSLRSLHEERIAGRVAAGNCSVGADSLQNIAACLCRANFPEGQAARTAWVTAFEEALPAGLQAQWRDTVHLVPLTPSSQSAPPPAAAALLVEPRASARPGSSAPSLQSVPSCGAASHRHPCTIMMWDVQFHAASPMLGSPLQLMPAASLQLLPAHGDEAVASSSSRLLQSVPSPPSARIAEEVAPAARTGVANQVSHSTRPSARRLPGSFVQAAPSALIARPVRPLGGGCVWSPLNLRKEGFVESPWLKRKRPLMHVVVRSRGLNPFGDRET